MRLVIIVLLGLFYSTVVYAQDDRHLKGQAIDITHNIYQGGNDSLTVIFLDGYKLKRTEMKKIGGNGVKFNKFNIKFINDSTVYIKSKFVYYIDGTIYRNRERQVKLKSMNSHDIASFEVLSQQEARDKLGITARYGLIQMETK